MAKQKDNNKNNLYDTRYYKSLSGEAALKERLIGRLPIIGIAGHPFFVDTRIGLLRPKDDFSTMGIEINNIPVDEVTRQLSFYYHIPTKTKVDIYSDITELPKDVVTVQVPEKLSLDPVAMARDEGKDPGYYLDKHPLKMYREAVIIPLEKTLLPSIIKDNLEALKQRRDAFYQKNRPLPKRRKGKGL